MSATNTKRFNRLLKGSLAAQELKDRAWHRYASISHADLNVGTQEYRDEIERINQMEERNG